MDEFSKYWISTNDVLYYHHSFGFLKNDFNNSDVIILFNKNINLIYHQLVKENFIITGYSKNPEGKEFVASIESNKYPFYGVQFHPEKAMFIWKTGIIYLILTFKE